MAIRSVSRAWSSWLLASCVALAACSDGGTPFNGDVHGGDATGTDIAFSRDVPPIDLDAMGGDDTGGGDVVNIYDTSTGQDACPFGDGGACTPMTSLGCVAAEVCGNGLDDNCNGMSDEGCPCVPGTVQDCFLGPPAHRNIGACHDGSQRCEGSGEFGTWSACAGGISPSTEVCDELDNDCNGCADDGLCCRADVTCPGPGDPRVPDGQPFAVYPLHGEAFFTGAAASWAWTVVGGPCDTLLPRPTYTLTGADTMDPTFTPTLSGDYTVTFTVRTTDGRTVTCTFIVHIAGPGLRVELCWDTSTTVDLDLYLHDPSTMSPWFSSSASPLSSVTNASCNWSNCEAVLRGSTGRENWSLPDSALTNCQNGPHGSDWRSLGSCSNPRLDIDNNLEKSTGTPENINVDDPTDGQHFRAMVQNYTGSLAHPIVNVYCGGHLRGTVGAAPDLVASFTGASGGGSVGAMWRAADITVHVDASGTTTDCDVAPVRPPGATSGYDVTYGMPRY